MRENWKTHNGKCLAVKIVTVSSTPAKEQCPKCNGGMAMIFGMSGKNRYCRMECFDCKYTTKAVKV